jgi:transcriptional regulator with XRE-family HTH domain
MGTRKIELGDVGLRVAAQIRQIRERKGLSLQDLSESLSRIGRPILPSGLWKIEQGTRRVDVDDLAAITRALETVPSALLDPAPEDIQTASGEHADALRAALEALGRCEQMGVNRYQVVEWYNQIDAERERLSAVLSHAGLSALPGPPPGVVVRPSDWYERAKRAKGGADV